MPLQCAAARRCCQNAVCAWEFGCTCRCFAGACTVPLHGATAGCCFQDAAVKVLCALLSLGAGAAGCCCRVLLQGAAVSALGLGCWCRSLLGTAAGYRCRVPLCYKVPPSECSLRFGAWLLVPLQGAAAGQRLQGAARYCCRMFAGCLCWRCLRFGAWLCRAPLQGVPLQGAAARCCCQSAAFGLGCWCHCWAPLQGAAAKVLLPRCFLHFGAQF